MKNPHARLTTASVLVLGTMFATEAMAADVPQRKSGLWELRTQMEGMPHPGAMQVCVDKASDNVMQERARERANCSVMDVNRSVAGKVTVHSVCKVEDTTATTDAVITGDFDSGYKSDMRIRYAPAKHGVSEMHMIQEARWLGACKPGQKPGDVIMPGMPSGAANMQEMMKDPHYREMMKQRRQPGQY